VYLLIFLTCLLSHFFFNDTATTEIYTLSLHDALPISSDENIFIAGACAEKGIAFLKGESPLMVRKKDENYNKGEVDMAGNYTVVVDGKNYSVQVAEGEGDIQIAPAQVNAVAEAETPTVLAGGAGSVEIQSQTPGNVWKITKNPGDTVAEGDVIMILEAMKMEIDITAPKAGKIASINVNVNDSVADAQLLATME